MWAAGIVAALLAGGVTVYAERGPVRRFVATVRSNAMPVLASDPSAAAPREAPREAPRAATETEGADKCAGNRSDGPSGTAERQDDGCGNSQSATLSK
jgi:hypothetical protein